MFLKIALVVLFLLVAFLLVAAFQPDHFRVERSIRVAAAPEAVFPQVNELANYTVWNPWAKHDPNLQGTFSGPRAGVGSSYAWVSDKVGTGQMTIVETRPPEWVRMRLDFLKPFKATHTAEFELQPTDGGTTVTWSMYGQNNYLAKIMSLVMSMDRMVGGEFEKGLAEMKTLVEREVR